MELMAVFKLLHVAWSAPELTAVDVASIKKKCTGGIGGRTMNEGGAANSTVP